MKYAELILFKSLDELTVLPITGTYHNYQTLIFKKQNAQNVLPQIINVYQ